MRTQTRILTSVAASLAISAVVLLIVFSVLRGARRELARGRLYEDILSQTYALNILITKSHELDRSLIRQIGEVRTSLKNLLNRMTPFEAGEQTLARQIRTNYRELGYSIEKLILTSLESGSGLEPERYNFFVSQLKMKIQFISDDINRLIDSSQSRTASGQQKAGIWIIGLIVALVLINAGISFFSGRRISQSEEALRENEERLRDRAARLQATLDAAPSIIWTAHDRECRSITGNLEAQRFSRVPEKTNMSKTGSAADRLAHYRIFKDGVELRPEEFPIQRVAASGEPLLDYAMDFVFDDGTTRSLLGNVVPVFDDSGQPCGAIAAFMEITERKQSEEELRKLNETLEQRVAERTELAESRARQLARLTSELALAEERERRRLAEVLHDHLQQLLVAARLSLDILFNQAADDQKQALEAARSLLAESIQTSRSITAELSPPILYQNGLAAGLEWLSRWMREKHGFSLELQIEPDIVVHREAMLVVLFKTVRELLFNVVKHSGVNTAKASLFRDGPDRIKIVVSDSGKGFDPDRKLENSEEKGGYGLFAIRERLEFLGGKFEVESSPGRGASFTITVPVEKTRAAQKSAVIPEVAPSKPSERRSLKLRTLLVDDHAVVREGLSMILSAQEDIEVVGHAADGEEAVKLAREIEPDVILMDISLPKVNGIEATRRIHAEQPGIRIICLSMFEDHEMASSALESGAADYLTKSGDTDVLLSAIRGEGKAAFREKRFTSAKEARKQGFTSL